jgi:type VI secretion system protein ImpF
MALRSNQEFRVTPSILDRLIDNDPRSSQDPPPSRSASVADLKQAVRRDLEWLLNTRHSPNEVPHDLDEVNKSLAVYGLPDTTGIAADDANEQKRLIKAVENAIRTFEPRFIDLKVTLLPITNVERELKFRIEANLDVEPAPEPVSFDTVLQTGRGDFVITPLGS